MNKAEHLIVISVDGLKSSDYSLISRLKNFRKLMDNGSYCMNVESVYPTLTYPAHTTIITGVYPKTHGIVNNILLEPGKEKPDWYWYSKYVKADTLYGQARKKGMKVASLLWPVMAGAKINYNFPEIWPNKKEQKQLPLSLKTGSPIFMIDIFMRYGKLLQDKNLPQLDNFVTASASYIIKKRRPNLMLIHLLALDDKRHKHGVDSKETEEALLNMDKKLGELIEAACSSGIIDSTAFIVLGDHGFIDIHSKIKLNTELLKLGLIETDKNGQLSDWRAYCNYCDGSAYIYIKDKNDSKSTKKVSVLLEGLLNDRCGIEKVYNRGEALSMGADDNCIFMLEAENGYCFDNSIDGRLIEKTYSTHIAGHGFLPEKEDCKTIFIASGCSIKKGIIVPKMKLIDEGPTMAAVLGLDLPNADGKALNEILA